MTEEGYDSDEEEEDEEEDDEPHKPILSLRRKKKEVSDSEEFDGNQGRVIQFHGKEEGESVKVIRAQTFNEAQIVAVDGSLKAISNNIFIVAPGNIEVTGDLREELVSEDMLSPELSNF